MDILIEVGGPGKPGVHVTNADISLQAPRPHEFMPATLNLYVVPGSNSFLAALFSSLMVFWIFHNLKTKQFNKEKKTVNSYIQIACQ